MMTRMRARALVIVGSLAATLGVVPVLPGAVPSVGAAAILPKCTLCAGGEYHPLTPERIFDTRTAYAVNDVAPLGAKPTATSPAVSTFDVQLIGEPGDPITAADPGVDTTDVLAVMVSIAVISPMSNGWLSAYPSGTVPSTLSAVVNFGAGQTISNLAIVRPGSNGKLTIRMNTAWPASAHVTIDVFGWFSSSTYEGPVPYDPTNDQTSVDSQLDERGSRLITVSPGRLLDTRVFYGGAGPLGEGETRELTILGADTIAAPLVTDIVPNDVKVTGVLLNVTAVDETKGGYISVLPETPTGDPTTANLLFVPKQVKGNLVAVPVGADGKVRLFNKAGSADVIVDIMGYFLSGAAENTRNGRVVPLTAPFRVFDTRDALFGAVPLGPGQAEDWSFSGFAGSVTIGGVSVGNQQALIGNLTSASLSRVYASVPVMSYLTAYPSDAASQPLIANLNTSEGAETPNMAVFRYGSPSGAKPYQVRIFNNQGYSHYIMDVSAVVLAD